MTDSNFNPWIVFDSIVEFECFCQTHFPHTVDLKNPADESLATKEILNIDGPARYVGRVFKSIDNVSLEHVSDNLNFSKTGSWIKVSDSYYFKNPKTAMIIKLAYG